MRNYQRRTWAEINLDNIAYNLKIIKNAVSSKICCVIKADAYGHGAVMLAKEYEKLGVDFFGVSNIDEALQIRRANVKTPILIFGYTPPNDAELLSENNISQCVYSKDYAEELSRMAVKSDTNVKIHLKIDTGMSRLGFYFQDPKRDTAAIEEVRDACNLPNLIAEGIFTHFAVADEGKTNFTLKQYNCFAKMIDKLESVGINFSYRHCANSGAILDFPTTHLDMVRAGIILYGLPPSEDINNKLDLRPALELKSVISHVKIIEPDTDVSYGRTFTAKKKMRIATVPIGYADGYTRILANAGAELLVCGKRCRIIGRVCMDQLMIDLGDLENVKIGDIVTVIGSDRNESILADEIAKLRESINYEVICDIGARVPRIYLKNGKEIGILNYIGM